MPCYQLNTQPQGYYKIGQGGFANEEDCLNACKEGACCEPDGACNIKPQCQCQGEGQTFEGVGTTCVEGACCEPDGTCSVKPECGCRGPGQTFFGEGSTCEPNPCIGACCTQPPFGQIQCSQTNESDCGGTFIGAAIPCNACAAGSPFLACTVNVHTAFGSFVMSCATRGAILSVPCGFVRDFDTFANPVQRPVGRVALGGFFPAVCGNKVVVAEQDCDSTQDGPQFAVNANISVSVRREDSRTGLGGGGTEEIVTMYHLRLVGSSATVSQVYSGRVGFGVLGGTWVGPGPQPPAPPGSSDIPSLEGKRCSPCGVYNSGGGFGWSASRSYHAWNDIDCCAGDISHSVSVACAP